MDKEADTPDDLDKRKYEFKRLLEDYEEHTGSGTQLVTIYVPEDKQISDVVSHVTQEHSQAANIKSKDTRTNVTNALASIRARLRYYKKPPTNGMVLFSGAVNVGSGQTDMVTEIFESPPQPIQTFRYHCDSTFLTEPLRDMLLDVGLYGLLVLDRREAHVGWLKGKRIELVKGTTSRVPGKQRKGGQSAQRFHRLRLEAIDQFYKEIAKCKMALNLSRGRAMKYYSSNRIASLVANGIMTFIDNKVGYSDFFDDTEMGFYKNVDDLLIQIDGLHSNINKVNRISKNGKVKVARDFCESVVVFESEFPIMPSGSSVPKHFGSGTIWSSN